MTGNDGAAREEHRRDVDIHHPAPLLERDLGEGAHRERGVEPGVVDKGCRSSRTARPVRSAIRATFLLGGDVDRQADTAGEGGRCLLRTLQVGNDDAAPLPARPFAIARPIPCAAPVTSATLPSSAPSPERREGRRHEGSGSAACASAAAPLSGNACHRPSAWRRARFSVRSAYRVVTAERRVRRERADVGRERADEAAEELLLERDALGLVETKELRAACP